jgi:hypothetical protein
MFTALLLLLLPAQAHASEALRLWVESVTPPAASIALAQTLPTGPTQVPASVPLSLSEHTRTTLAAHAGTKIQAAKTACTSGTDIDFVQATLQSDDPTAAHFFDSTIHMESIFCLDKGSAAQALNIFRSAEFRISSLPLVIGFEAQGSQTCIRTQSALGGALDPTAICSEATVYSGPDFSAVVGWLTKNTGGSDHQSLFYRHYVIAFVDRPGGGVAGFRGVVTRSKDLGMLQKKVVQASALQAHTLMERKLGAMIPTD